MKGHTPIMPSHDDDRVPIEAYFRRQMTAIGTAAMEQIGLLHVLVQCLAAKCLAQSGVQRLTLLDDELFLLREGDFGKPKAKLMASRLNELNPFADVRAMQGTLTLELMLNFHVIVFASPNITIEELVAYNEFCRAQAPPIGFVVAEQFGAASSQSLFRQPRTAASIRASLAAATASPETLSQLLEFTKRVSKVSLDLADDSAGHLHFLQALVNVQLSPEAPPVPLRTRPISLEPTRGRPLVVPFPGNGGGFSRWAKLRVPLSKELQSVGAIAAYLEVDLDIELVFFSARRVLCCVTKTIMAMMGAPLSSEDAIERPVAETHQTCEFHEEKPDSSESDDETWALELEEELFMQDDATSSATSSSGFAAPSNESASCVPSRTPPVHGIAMELPQEVLVNIFGFAQVGRVCKAWSLAMSTLSRRKFSARLTETLSPFTSSAGVVAQDVESALFDAYGHRFATPKAYGQRARQLLFNLKDARNSALRERLFTGELTASALVRMSATDMANPQLVQQRRQWIKKRTHEVMRDAGTPDGFTPTSLFECRQWEV
ncbi:hypothetical protein P43SY_008946 [Pythium insidiosum]|uniref:TFIIS central domain-containing protein n=1 Tax=Pythium insidiosum TaxID=114742 RepID=A0AAD5LPF7_PYTIN|nr:hypothetical protein P43SY_008946 [Pythium insidiosum]